MKLAVNTNTSGKGCICAIADQALFAIFGWHETTQQPRDVINVQYLCKMSNGHIEMSSGHLICPLDPMDRHKSTGHLIVQ